MSLEDADVAMILILLTRPPRKQPNMTWICQIWVYDLYYGNFDLQYDGHLIFAPLRPNHGEI